MLHQSPQPDNHPLYWYGYCLAKFLRYDLGPYQGGRREVLSVPMGEPNKLGAEPLENRRWAIPTWLSDKRVDMNELVNLAEEQPGKLREMQRILKQKLHEVGAPAEQLERLGIADG